MEINTRIPHSQVKAGDIFLPIQTYLKHRMQFLLRDLQRNGNKNIKKQSRRD